MPEDTSKPVYRDVYAKRFGGMAAYWTECAAQARRDFHELKFQKQKTPDGPGHRSKKEFEDYRKTVFTYSKVYESNASLCIAAANAIENGTDSVDFEEEGKSKIVLFSEIGKKIVDRMTGRDLG